MRLLLIRHGKAVDREEFSDKDALRPLTCEGRRQLKKEVPAFAALAPNLQRIWQSSLLRAKQTAEILATGFPGVEISECLELTPGSEPEKTTSILFEQSFQELALVGHEPHLSLLASYLLSGKKKSFIVLKKAGAICIEFDSQIKVGQGRLCWHLEPAQMRRLSEAFASRVAGIV